MSNITRSDEKDSDSEKIWRAINNLNIQFRRFSYQNQTNNRTTQDQAYRGRNYNKYNNREGVTSRKGRARFQARTPPTRQGNRAPSVSTNSSETNKVNNSMPKEGNTVNVSSFNGSGLFVKAKINELEVDCLIDTGATLTLVSMCVYELLRQLTEEI